jgi:hypothetical protein
MKQQMTYLGRTFMALRVRALMAFMVEMDDVEYSRGGGIMRDRATEEKSESEVFGGIGWKAFFLVDVVKLPCDVLALSHFGPRSPALIPMESIDGNGVVLWPYLVNEA